MNPTQEIKRLAVIQPAAIVNTGSWTCVEIDTLGFDYLDIIFQLGALDIALTVLKVQESDVTSSGQTDITGGAFGGTGNPALPGATSDNLLFEFHIDLVGRKRFITLVATIGTGVAGGYASAIALLSRAKIAPSSASDRGLTSEIFI